MWETHECGIGVCVECVVCGWGGDVCGKRMCVVKVCVVCVCVCVEGVVCVWITIITHLHRSGLLACLQCCVEGRRGEGRG